MGEGGPQGKAARKAGAKAARKRRRAEHRDEQSIRRWNAMTPEQQASARDRARNGR